MRSKALILRDQLYKRLRRDAPALAHAVRSALPSTRLEDTPHGRVLVLRYRAATQRRERVLVERERQLIADQLVELGDPDLPPLGIATEMYADDLKVVATTAPRRQRA